MALLGVLEPGMVGPVYSLEWLLGTRRGRLTAFRRLWAAALVLQFAVLFALHLAYTVHPTTEDELRFLQS